MEEKVGVQNKCQVTLRDKYGKIKNERYVYPLPDDVIQKLLQIKKMLEKKEVRQ